MKNDWEKKVLVVIVLASVILAVGSYGLMPDLMVTHWGIYGEPNGWMGRFWGVAMFPLMNILMLGLYFFVLKFEPKQENLNSFRKEYDKLILWIVGILNYIFVLSFVYNLGIKFDMGKMVMPALGLLYIAMGTILPKAKQNFMVGIKTPWTLASEKVWKKTHVLGGKLFMVSGVLSILAVFLPSVWGFYVVIGSVMITTLIVMLYSWREYRREG